MKILILVLLLIAIALAGSAFWSLASGEHGTALLEGIFLLLLLFLYRALSKRYT